MARPQRNNVDYFPFICKEGETTKYIDNTYGNDGFATWVKILRALAITDYHYLDLSNRKKLLTLCSTCKVSEEFLLTILNDLAEFDEIDRDLWLNEKIVWSDQFIESVEDAYAKRSNKIIKREEFMQLLAGLRGRKLGLRESKGPVNPQSKVEYSKVEESKGESDAPASKEIFLKEIFSDEVFMTDLKMTHPGKDLKKAFNECWLWHTQKPSPPQHTWEWKQKLNTWLANTKIEKKHANGTNSKIRNPISQPFGTL